MSDYNYRRISTLEGKLEASTIRIAALEDALRVAREALKHEIEFRAEPILDEAFDGAKKALSRIQEVLK